MNEQMLYGPAVARTLVRELREEYVRQMQEYSVVCSSCVPNVGRVSVSAKSVMTESGTQSCVYRLEYINVGTQEKRVRFLYDYQEARLVTRMVENCALQTETDLQTIVDILWALPSHRREI